jgi:CoA:oxalate CoA-transferase
MKEKLLTQYASHIISGPLNGVIVVGYCYYLAGPIALQNLARLGALVIKVEQPTGDPSRNVFSPPIFTSLTHGQLSVTVDSKQEKDQQFLQALLRTADVVVDNRSVDAQEGDKVLQNHLKMDKQNPQIYCTINGFPNAKINRMPGLDASAQAITGFAYSNGSTTSGPLKVGVPVLDIVTGSLAVTHITAGLFFLEKNKLPLEMKNMMRIEASLAGTSLWLQSGQVINAFEGRESVRRGNQDQFAAPFSYYTTKNGFISIATVNETQFENFCLHVLKNKDFHDKYPSVQTRIAFQDNFERELNDLLKVKDKEYWARECQIYKVPVSPVLTVSEAIQEPFFAKEIVGFSQDGKPIITTGITCSMFAPKREGYTPAPSVGQHSASLRRIADEKEEQSLQICSKL